MKPKIYIFLLVAVCGGALIISGYRAEPTAQATKPANQPSPNISGTVESSTASSSGFAPSVYRTFGEWKRACDRLPPNRSLKRSLPAKELLPLKTFRQFEEVLDAFLDLSTKGTLGQPSNWVGIVPGRAEFFNTSKFYFRHEIPFQPFAQKLLVPPNAEVLFHGDFHGDIRSLLTWMEWLNSHGYLKDFTITRPDTYIVLLGDYTDRGWYGVEVLYTLFRLKLANPERVILLRGNHEDVSLASTYGFFAECRVKYNRDFNMDKVLRTFDFFPVVAYVGSGENFVQCNHGGMEPGFDPGNLLEAEGAARFGLLGRLNQATFRRDNPSFVEDLDAASKRTAEAHLQDFQPIGPVAPVTLGFMWNDFSVVKGEPQLVNDPGRAIVYGDRATSSVLTHASTATKHVRAVFRAHQHSSLPNPMMRRLKAAHGLFQHWQPTDSLELLPADESKLMTVIDSTQERSIAPGSVWTFNVAPDSVYGDGCNFDFDTFAILSTRERFEDWKLKRMNLSSK